jgi:hypothetical protein
VSRVETNDSVRIAAQVNVTRPSKSVEEIQVPRFVHRTSLSKMSNKATIASEDRIPTYEESIATTSTQRTSDTSRKNPPQLSMQDRIRTQRRQRVANLLQSHVEPAIAAHLEDTVNDMSLVLLPPDTSPSQNPIPTSSITSPPLPKSTTLLQPPEQDYKSAFLTSWSVVQDLSDTLIRSLIDPSILPELQALLPDISSNNPTTTEGLPERPMPRSWLKRTFGPPSAGHDPTGETGKWNLGWRSEEDKALTQRTITTSQATVAARLVDVSFRTESDLGLLESRTVKCLWIDVFIRT